MVDQSDLTDYLAAVQQRYSVAGEGNPNEGDFLALLAEVRALATCIICARQDLTALGAADIVARHVPSATDELDAIVAHTAAATGTILDVCEGLERDVANTTNQTLISSAAARIYEACSFQDITGQRVAKVVQTLQIVEARVQAILRVFGQNAVSLTNVLQTQPLLNGPQIPRDAMDQIAVDALLAKFE